MLNQEHAAMAKANTPEYTDYANRPIKLTEAEQRYFRDTVFNVLFAVSINIPVYMCDHERLPGDCENALGMHWKNAEGDEFITIDNYFIHECYEVAFNGAYDINGEDLVSVLCHELAHIHYRRHTKYHEELTEKYIGIVRRVK